MGDDFLPRLLGTELRYLGVIPCVVVTDVCEPNGHANKLGRKNTSDPDFMSVSGQIWNSLGHVFVLLSGTWTVRILVGI